MPENNDPWSPDGGVPDQGATPPTESGDTAAWSATPPVPPIAPPTVGSPDAPPSAHFGGIDPIDAITTESTVSSGGGVGKFVAAGVGVALIAGGGFFAASQLAGNSGGASSPQAAVESMLDAVENEDIIGVLEALAPSERELLLEPTVQTASELSRIGVLPDDFALDGVDGVDITFSDLVFDIDEINSEIATVHVDGGTASITVDGENLPVGSLITDLTLEMTGEPLDLSEATTEDATDIADDPMRVTTIKRNGGWYVSFGYSMAETARLESDAPAPDPSARLSAAGAESPEAALENMLVAAADLDLEGMITLLAPDTFDALYDYAPLFLTDAQAELDRSFRESGATINLQDVVATSRSNGSTTFVSIEGFKLEVAAEGETALIEFAEGCVTVDAAVAGIDQRFCGADDLTALGLGEGEEIENFADIYTSMIAAITEPAQGLIESLAEVETGIVAVEIDGRWYLDPVRSGTTAMVGMMRAIERTDIEDAVRGYAMLAESFEDGTFFEELYGEDDFGFGGEPFTGGSTQGGQVAPDTPIGGGYTAGDLLALLTDQNQFTEQQASCFVDHIVLESGFDTEVLLEIHDAIAFNSELGDVGANLVSEAVTTCLA